MSTEDWSRPGVSSILAELEPRLATPHWMSPRIGCSPEGFGLLLGWSAAIACIDELPATREARFAFATILPPLTARAHLTGFAAGLRVLEHLDPGLPARGFPGLIGAASLVDADKGERAVATAKECWESAKAHYPQLGDEIDAVDEAARQVVAAGLREIGGFDDATIQDVVEVAVGFERPAKPRTPTRSGFIHAVMWREYTAGRLADVVPANLRESELTRAYESAVVSAVGHGEVSPRPMPWPRDLRCRCGKNLAPFLFCCDRTDRIDPSSLAAVDERTLWGPCARCGSCLPGFVCDACGTPNAWSHGTVPSHRG